MRLLLEGTDIEELLAQVRREHGGAARIIAADKVRSGGVAGFFARERYEVTVEIDDASAVVPSVTMPSVGIPSVAVPSVGIPSVTMPSVGMPPAVVHPEPTTLLELAAAVDSAERASELRFQPLVSAETETAPVVSTQTHGFAAVLRQLADDTDGLVSEPPVGPTLAAAPEVAAIAEVAPLAPVERRVAGRHARPTTDLAVGNDVRNVVVQDRPEGIAAAPESEGSWAALGLPAELRPAPVEGVPAVRLLRSALEQLPQPPRTPKGAGDVIVVAGPAAQAYQAAQEVAQRLRLDPATVLLAAATAAVPGLTAARRLIGPEDARRKLRAIRRNPHPTVVAVDAGMEEGAPEWAREVADVLEADAVWAVVDATTKTNDAAGQLRRLAPVQALLVRNARRTSDPGSVLALGVPVASIDGVAATPAAWASLLCERLLESA
ncbi:MAG: hypothetical protein ACTHK1_04070 [Actinomycetales bacterium]